MFESRDGLLCFAVYRLSWYQAFKSLDLFGRPMDIECVDSTMTCLSNSRQSSLYCLHMYSIICRDIIIILTNSECCIDNNYSIFRHGHIISLITKFK